MMEIQGYILSDDKALLQLDRVCEMLWTTYWAKDRPKGAIAKSIEHSLCFGVYRDGAQVGFARAITDYATMYYHGLYEKYGFICDNGMYRPATPAPA